MARSNARNGCRLRVMTFFFLLVFLFGHLVLGVECKYMPSLLLIWRPVVYITLIISAKYARSFFVTQRWSEVEEIARALATLVSSALSH